MNNLLRILVLSHLSTSLFMYGAAQPARESQTQEINFYTTNNDSGSTIHISYDAPHEPTKTQVKKIETRLQELQNNIQNAPTMDPSWKITAVHINISPVNLNSFVNVLRFFPYVEELKIDIKTRTPALLEESETEHLTKTIQSYAPGLKVLSILNCTIKAQALNKLVEGLKNQPHLESLEIEFESIKELEIPSPQTLQNFFKGLLYLEKEINTSSTQKCSELLASLTHLKLLKIKAKQAYKPEIYKELFKPFAATSIQQIEIEDSKLFVITIPNSFYTSYGNNAEKTFQIQKDGTRRLIISVTHTNVCYWGTIDSD